MGRLLLGRALVREYLGGGLGCRVIAIHRAEVWGGVGKWEMGNGS